MLERGAVQSAIECASAVCGLHRVGRACIERVSGVHQRGSHCGPASAFVVDLGLQYRAGPHVAVQALLLQFGLFGFLGGNLFRRLARCERHEGGYQYQKTHGALNPARPASGNPHTCEAA